MGKMPYMFFIAFSFWKLNPPGWFGLLFLTLMLGDAGWTIYKMKH